MPLIHSYTYGCGGLGDFLRSLFAYYVYCHINNIPFFLYIKGHPFESCFKMNEIPEEYLTNLKHFEDIGSSSDKTTEEILRTIKETNCSLISNKFDFVSFKDLQKYRNNFLEFLQLTELVNTRILFLRNSYNLNKYNSIHIRLGDRLMEHVNISCDIRVKDNKSFNSDLVTSLKFLKNKNIPIVIFTDNNTIKDQFKGNKTINLDPHTVIDVTVLNTRIHHTALESVDISNTVDAIAEFFIMGQSDSIVTMSSSGFSFWSAFLFNRDLYHVMDNTIRPFKETDLKYK